MVLFLGSMAVIAATGLLFLLLVELAGRQADEEWIK